MKRNKHWIKYICYFIIGFLILTIFASISQVDMLKELNMKVDIKTIVLHTMKSGIILYTIIYFLILILNVLYNLRLIKKLNEESEKVRKASSEKILKERREITMKKKVFITIVALLIISLIIFVISTARKTVILTQYTEAVESRGGNTNYYVKTINNDETTNEVIGKDSIKIFRQISKDGTIRMLYQEGDEIKVCVNEPSGKKIATNVGEGIVPTYSGGDSYFSSILETENLLGKIKSIIETRITTEKLNGKECYRFYVSDELQAYVNKEDMVSIKDINGSTSKEYVEYKFGTVTDEDIEKIKPNLDEYTIQES